jgi:hypothetical protein
MIGGDWAKEDAGEENFGNKNPKKLNICKELETVFTAYATMPGYFIPILW